MEDLIDLSDEYSLSYIVKLFDPIKYDISPKLIPHALTFNKKLPSTCETKIKDVMKNQTELFFLQAIHLNFQNYTCDICVNNKCKYFFTKPQHSEITSSEYDLFQFKIILKYKNLVNTFVCSGNCLISHLMEQAFCLLPPQIDKTPIYMSYIKFQGSSEIILCVINQKLCPKEKNKLSSFASTQDCARNGFDIYLELEELSLNGCNLNKTNDFFTCLSNSKLMKISYLFKFIIQYYLYIISNYWCCIDFDSSTTTISKYSFGDDALNILCDTLETSCQRLLNESQDGLGGIILFKKACAMAQCLKAFLLFITPFSSMSQLYFSNKIYIELNETTKHIKKLINICKPSNVGDHKNEISQLLDNLQMEMKVMKKLMAPFSLPEVRVGNVKCLKNMNDKILIDLNDQRNMSTSTPCDQNNLETTLVPSALVLTVDTLSNLNIKIKSLHNFPYIDMGSSVKVYLHTSLCHGTKVIQTKCILLNDAGNYRYLACFDDRLTCPLVDFNDDDLRDEKEIETLYSRTNHNPNPGHLISDPRPRKPFKFVMDQAIDFEIAISILPRESYLLFCLTFSELVPNFAKAPNQNLNVDISRGSSTVQTTTITTNNSNNNNYNTNSHFESANFYLHSKTNPFIYNLFSSHSLFPPNLPRSFDQDILSLAHAKISLENGANSSEYLSDLPIFYTASGFPLFSEIREVGLPVSACGSKMLTGPRLVFFTSATSLSRYCRCVIGRTNNYHSNQSDASINKSDNTEPLLIVTNNAKKFGATNFENLENTENCLQCHRTNKNIILLQFDVQEKSATSCEFSNLTYPETIDIKDIAEASLNGDSLIKIDGKENCFEEIGQKLCAKVGKLPSKSVENVKESGDEPIRPKSLIKNRLNLLAQTELERALKKLKNLSPLNEDEKEMVWDKRFTIAKLIKNPNYTIPLIVQANHSWAWSNMPNLSKFMEEPLFDSNTSCQSLLSWDFHTSFYLLLPDFPSKMVREFAVKQLSRSHPDPDVLNNYVSQLVLILLRFECPMAFHNYPSELFAKTLNSPFFGFLVNLARCNLRFALKMLWELNYWQTAATPELYETHRIGQTWPELQTHPSLDAMFDNSCFPEDEEEREQLTTEMIYDLFADVTKTDDNTNSMEICSLRRVKKLLEHSKLPAIVSVTQLLSYVTQDMIVAKYLQECDTDADCQFTQCPSINEFFNAFDRTRVFLNQTLPALSSAIKRIKDDKLRDTYLHSKLLQIDRDLFLGNHTQDRHEKIFPRLMIPMFPIGTPIIGIDVNQCTYFKSKTLPLKITFRTADDVDNLIDSRRLYSPTPSLIYKEGDDVRQDQFCLSIIRLMDILWLSENLDLSIVTFECLPLGPQRGIVRFVEDCETMRNIQTYQTAGIGGSGGSTSATAAALLSGNFRNNSAIYDWLLRQNSQEIEFTRAIEAFTRSCAGYCVATYVLGICDRHNDNIMIKKTGQMFHIDFGKILGDAQMFGNLKRDRVPFVFTSDMAYVINQGNTIGPNFQRFIDLCAEAFNVIRHNSFKILTHVKLMEYGEIPGIPINSIDFVRNKLLLDLSDIEATSRFTKMIKESLSSKFTQFNFFIHGLMNKDVAGGNRLSQNAIRHQNTSNLSSLQRNSFSTKSIGFRNKKLTAAITSKLASNNDQNSVIDSQSNLSNSFVDRQFNRREVKRTYSYENIHENSVTNHEKPIEINQLPTTSSHSCLTESITTLPDFHFSFTNSKYSCCDIGNDVVKSVRALRVEKIYDAAKLYVYVCQVEFERSPVPVAVYRTYQEFNELRLFLNRQFPLAMFPSLPNLRFILSHQHQLHHRSPSNLSMKPKTSSKFVTFQRGLVYVVKLLDSLNATTTEVRCSPVVITFFYPIVRDQRERTIMNPLKASTIRRQNAKYIQQLPPICNLESGTGMSSRSITYHSHLHHPEKNSRDKTININMKIDLNCLTQQPTLQTIPTLDTLNNSCHGIVNNLIDIESPSTEDTSCLLDNPIIIPSSYQPDMFILNQDTTSLPSKIKEDTPSVLISSEPGYVSFQTHNNNSDDPQIKLTIKLSQSNSSKNSNTLFPSEDANLSLTPSHYDQSYDLQILIHHSKNLPIVPDSNKTGPDLNYATTDSTDLPDSYVKVTLQPDPDKCSKRKTPIVYKTCHPSFNQMITYENMSLLKIKAKTLRVYVMYFERFRENVIVGRLELPLTDIHPDKTYTSWYRLIT